MRYLSLSSPSESPSSLLVWLWCPWSWAECDVCPRRWWRRTTCTTPRVSVLRTSWRRPKNRRRNTSASPTTSAPASCVTVTMSVHSAAALWRRWRKWRRRSVLIDVLQHDKGLLYTLKIRKYICVERLVFQHLLYSQMDNVVEATINPFLHCAVSHNDIDYMRSNVFIVVMHSWSALGIHFTSCTDGTLSVFPTLETSQVLWKQAEMHKGPQRLSSQSDGHQRPGGQILYPRCLRYDRRKLI